LIGASGRCRINILLAAMPDSFEHIFNVRALERLGGFNGIAGLSYRPLPGDPGGPTNVLG